MVTVALFGSRPVSHDCFEILHSSPDVELAAVVTYPPDHEGWWDGSLYDIAAERGYDCVGPEDILEYDIDYILSVQYHDILDGELLAHPSEGGLNLHMAELPRYRGSDVFTHSILNARDDDYWKHGTTLHFMEETVDTGDVVTRRFLDITEDHTARTLYEETEQVSVGLFQDILPKIVSGEVQEMRTPQSEFDGKRYEYRRADLDGKKYIPPETLRDPERELEVYDKIRAFDFPPFEPAYTELNGRKIYLTKTSYEALSG